GVAVDEDRPDALGPEGAAGLGAGVIELGGLADHDGPGAEDQDRGGLEADCGDPVHCHVVTGGLLGAINRPRRTEFGPELAASGKLTPWPPPHDPRLRPLSS